jgi:hypothetical protein
MTRTPKTAAECEGATRLAWRAYQEYERQRNIMHRSLVLIAALLVTIYIVAG